MASQLAGQQEEHTATNDMVSLRKNLRVMDCSVMTKENCPVNQQTNVVLKYIEATIKPSPEVILTTLAQKLLKLIQVYELCMSFLFN